MACKSLQESSSPFSGCSEFVVDFEALAHPWSTGTLFHCENVTTFSGETLPTHSRLPNSNGKLGDCDCLISDVHN